MVSWRNNVWRCGMAIAVAVLVWLGNAGLNLPLGSNSSSFAHAATAASREVVVHLGTESGELKFVPSQFEFQVGQRYKLVLDNPSPEKHYFTAKDFSDAIWSQKVEAGNVEVKGAIHELELKPGAIAEWLFVPEKTGTFELHCSIPGHSDAGMKGQIVIFD